MKGSSVVVIVFLFSLALLVGAGFIYISRENSLEQSNTQLLKDLRGDIETMSKKQKEFLSSQDSAFEKQASIMAELVGKISGLEAAQAKLEEKQHKIETKLDSAYQIAHNAQLRTGIQKIFVTIDPIKFAEPLKVVQKTYMMKPAQTKTPLLDKAGVTKQ